MRELPPLDVFLSNDWIEGTAASRTLSTSMQAVVSPDAGRLIQFGELASLAADLVPEAVTQLWDIGNGAITMLQSGNAANVSGWAAALIKAVYAGLLKALQEGAAAAQTNALRSQWDIASFLLLKRTALAAELPGGGNFVMVQPGWKKDWPDAAVPAVPRPLSTYNLEGTPPYTIQRRITLFDHGTPDGIEIPEGCFSLGGGGCDLPADAVVGLSLLTWPILVEEHGLPWGGGQLLPFVTALCTPTPVHAQVRQATVDALTTRLRGTMRLLWRIQAGPPLRKAAVTIWPDGTYAEPSADQVALEQLSPRWALIDVAYQKWLGEWKASGVAELSEWAKTHPWEASKGGPEPIIPMDTAGPFLVISRDGYSALGDDPRAPKISPTFANLEHVSAAFRTLTRWQQCRDAMKRNFGQLPIEVQTLAAKSPDFAPAELAAAGGPNGGQPPPPPKNATTNRPTFNFKAR